MQIRFATVSGSKAAANIDAEHETVNSLLALAANLLGLPRDRLKIVVNGQPLTEASLRTIQEGDTLLALVAPRPPPTELRRAAEGDQREEDDEVIRFRLPANAPRWQRSLARCLQHRVGLPEVLLVLLFSLRRTVWVAVLAWAAGAKLASTLELGPLYMVATVFVVIILNLGRRREGEASAYSIFNNHQRLPGQLTAEHMDEQLRRGQL